MQVTGPFGATFLMPDDPSANIIMICTGTGSAPFRGFTERRRRTMRDAPGRMMLYFGARRPEELPYFGPLQKVPDGLLRKHFAYSRVPGEPKTYVQDRMRATAGRGRGVSEERQDAHLSLRPEGHGEPASTRPSPISAAAPASTGPHLRAAMRAQGRYHVETY